MSAAASAPRSERQLRTLFFGSGAFAVPIVEAVASLPALAVVAVVSVPDRPAGRGHRAASPPIVDAARRLAIPVLQPGSLREPATIEAIRAERPDLAVLADYGRIVPPDLLAIPPRGFLNLHPSLLPRHRGATPIQATILDGDREAGVSLFEMDAGLDTGPVVARDRWPLRGDETAPQLEAEAARRAADLLGATLDDWLAGRRPGRPQARAGASLTRPLRREDGRLDPARPAAELARRVRALQPWPGAFLDTAAGRLGVLAAAAVPAGIPDKELAEGRERPGELVADERGLALVASDGRLRLLRVTPAGGRPMTGEELVRGRPLLVGSMVGTGG